MISHEVMTKLHQHPIRNMNMINFIKQYLIHGIDRVENSVLIRGTSDQKWVYISSEDVVEFTELIGCLDDDDHYFAIIEDWMMPFLLEGKDLIWKLSCMKLYFPEDMEIPEPQYAICDLKREDADYIFNHAKYKDYTSVGYIQERINLGPALGIVRDDKLVAWLMTHDDGAMGFLHVLPEYRRKGYAADLTYELIRRLRSKGDIPFVHIEETNTQSMNLACKMGFVQDRLIHWFERR